jgi:hypothetical protein
LTRGSYLARVRSDATVAVDSLVQVLHKYRGCNLERPERLYTHLTGVDARSAELDSIPILIDEKDYRVQRFLIDRREAAERNWVRLVAGQLVKRIEQVVSSKGIDTLGQMGEEIYERFPTLERLELVPRTNLDVEARVAEVLLGFWEALPDPLGRYLNDALLERGDVASKLASSLVGDQMHVG